MPMQLCLFKNENTEEIKYEVFSFYYLTLRIRQAELLQYFKIMSCNKKIHRIL